MTGLISNRFINYICELTDQEQDLFKIFAIDMPAKLEITSRNYKWRIERLTKFSRA